MSSFNKVLLLGNVVKDIELKATPTGTQVAPFVIALERPRTKDGKEATDYINVISFGKLAENVSRFCGKGSKILVEGHLQVRSYDAKDGSKRYITEVIAETLTFVRNKKVETETSEEAPAKTATFVEVDGETDLPF